MLRVGGLTRGGCIAQASDRGGQDGGQLGNVWKVGGSELSGAHVGPGLKVVSFLLYSGSPQIVSVRRRVGSQPKITLASEPTRVSSRE